MNNILRFPRKENSVGDAHSAVSTVVDRPHILFDGRVKLYQRKDYAGGAWQCSIQLKDGSYERKSTKTSNLEKAKEIASERYREIAWLQSRGLSARKVLFSAAAEAWIADAQLKASLGGKNSSLNRNIGILRNHIIPYLGDKRLDLISGSNINAYHAFYKIKWKEERAGKYGGMAPSAMSMNCHERLIKVIIALAVEQNVLAQTEAPQFRVTKSGFRIRAGFTEDEKALLLSALEKQVHAHNHTGHIFIRQLLLYHVQFLLMTGIRPGVEALLVRFSDIQEISDATTPHAVIRVRDGKTGSRPVIVSREILPLIANIRGMDPDADQNTALFQTGSREGQRFNRMYKIILAELGMSTDSNGKPRTLYSCRHYAITSALLRNVNVNLIAENCGTSVAMIHLHYSYIFHERQAAELLK